MKKKICFLFVFICFGSFLSAASDAFRSYPREVAPLLERIEKLPEVRSLLSRIAKEGPIAVRWTEPHAGFSACWNSSDRIIFLNAAKRNTLGSLITSLVFELHNAEADRKFNALYDAALYGRMDEKSFVREMEYVEWLNCNKSDRILFKGIEEGYFPRDTRTYGWPHFDSYFAAQQRSGHSASYVRAYRNMRGMNHASL